ncbi:MAG: DUF6077 domain-containing protein [Firmicutes bacterium]|nr:DUF6077 domain-containing protein [Bacillota bacterium]MDY3769702.1 DUF6077 domain-containing protein [Lachnospiraceae bacterium]
MGNWLILPFLLLLCFLTGNILQYVTKEDKERLHLHPVLLGAVFWMCCIGSSLFLQDFDTIYRLFTGLTLGGTGIGILLFLLPSYRRFTAGQFTWKEKGGKQMTLLLIAFLAICASYYLKGFTLESYYDTPERVQTILFTGQFSGFNALTGAADNLPLRGDVLPVLYACLCRAFSLTPAQLLLQYLPPFLLLLIFLAMAALFTVLPVKKENLPVYLLFFALATICGASAYMNTSYGVLFAVYEGSVLSDHLVLCLLPVFVYGTGKTGKQKGIAGVMLLLLLVLSYVLGGRESLLVGVAALLLLFLVKIFLFLADCVAADRKKPEKRGDA